MTKKKNQTVTLSKDVYEAMNKEYTHVLSQYQNILALAMAADFMTMIRMEKRKYEYGSDKSVSLGVLYDSLLYDQSKALKTT